MHFPPFGVFRIAQVHGSEGDDTAIVRRQKNVIRERNGNGSKERRKRFQFLSILYRDWFVVSCKCAGTFMGIFLGIFSE